MKDSFLSLNDRKESFMAHRLVDLALLKLAESLGPAHGIRFYSPEVAACCQALPGPS